MKKEDKDLQLRDLCGRLPYLPKVHADDGLSPDGKGSDYTLLGINANKRIALLGLDFDGVYATYKEYMDNIKPYLRPLSSMTDEEKKDLLNYVVSKDSKYFEVCSDGSITDMSPDVQDFKSFKLKWINFNPNTTSRNIGWLLKNHFDFCDLIPKGLALEAPKDMYNEIKEEKK